MTQLQIWFSLVIAGAFVVVIAWRMRPTQITVVTPPPDPEDIVWDDNIANREVDGAGWCNVKAKCRVCDHTYVATVPADIDDPDAMECPGCHHDSSMVIYWY